MSKIDYMVSNGGYMNNAKMVAPGTINTKVLEALGAKKEQVGKTIFRLSPIGDSTLRLLAKSSKRTIREYLDFLAELAEETYANGQLPNNSDFKDGVRMSYTISKKAKETFARIAGERGTSRDHIVDNAILYILHKFKEKYLTIEEKIKYAEVLIKMRNDIADIYYSEENAEAMARLTACGDPDFSDCEWKIAHIEQFDELYLEDFIERKTNENNKTRE
jgi:DNA-binding PadR family transcriptional regulator